MLTNHRRVRETRCFVENLQQGSSPGRHRHSFGLSKLKDGAILFEAVSPHIPSVDHIKLLQCVELFVRLVEGVNDGNISAILGNGTAYRKPDSSATP